MRIRQCYLGFAGFYHTAVCLVGNGRDLRWWFQSLLGNEHRAEKLLLEAHPLQSGLEAFGLVLHFVQIVNFLIVETIVDGAFVALCL